MKDAPQTALAVISHRELETSIADFAHSTTRRKLSRAADIRRDKIRAVQSFFSFTAKSPDQVTVADVNDWHQWLLDEGKSKKIRSDDGTVKIVKIGLEESTIYTRFAHLSAYFEWLMKIPAFAAHLKTNPVRPAMPKPPKKYNSPKAKALTDEEFSKLWQYVEELAADDKNLTAVRDYAIFRFFAATGMRREEILGLRAKDVKITSEGILIHALVKGGDYEWRVIADEETLSVFERYLRLSKRGKLLGKDSSALWVRFDRGALAARIKHRLEAPNEDEPQLASTSFDKQMKRYAREAGIGHFHIHQFRHTFARIVAEEAGSLLETQDALGHADVQTTRVYVKRIQFKKDKFSRSIRQRVVQPTYENE